MIIQEEDYVKHSGKMGMHWGQRKSNVAKMIQKGALNVSANNKIIEAHNALLLSSIKKARAERIGNHIDKLKQKKVKELNKSADYQKLASDNILYTKRLQSKYASLNSQNISIGRALINYGKGSLNLGI